MKVVPIGLKGTRILHLLALLSEQKDSPTAFALARLIYRKCPDTRIDKSTGKNDPEKLARFDADNITEHFLPLKTSDRNYVWGKIKGRKSFTEPNFHDGDFVAFWAEALGMTKDPAYLDFRKKYGLDEKADDDDVEDDAEPEKVEEKK